MPVDTSSIFPPVLLDLQLTFFFKYPWKKAEVLITSGDVLIDFNVELIPNERGDICGFAKPVSPSFGSRHGVYVFAENQQKVADYLQKTPPDVLERAALIEGTAECAVDTGLISMSPDFVEELLAFSDRSYNEGDTIFNGFRKSKLSFNIYFELLTACIEGMKYKEYSLRIGEKSSLPKNVQREFFNALHNYNLHAVLTSSSTFIHFGSLFEFPNSCKEIIDKEVKPFYAQQNEEIKTEHSESVISYNSIDNRFVSGGNKVIILEDVKESILDTCKGNNILIGLRNWQSQFVIPVGMCLELRYMNNTSMILVYSLFDNFRRADSIEKITYCGVPIRDWLNIRGLKSSDIWDPNEEPDLLTAKLFSPDFTNTFLEGYWQSPGSDDWSVVFKKTHRYSIKYINDHEDIIERERRRIESRKNILRRLYHKHLGWKSISINDFQQTFDDKSYHDSLIEFYMATSDNVLRSYRNTLLSSVTDIDDDDLKESSFGIDEQTTSLKNLQLKLGVKKDQIVWARSPVRLDLAGGWSDTPPHTLRLGGCVVNFAANLNGQPPIQVFCRRTAEKHIRLHSIDLGTTETITDFETLEDYANPSASFSLPKAALCLMGITRESSGQKSLVDVLNKLGCGIEITLLCAIPKGSGLGTSSLLGATILGALYRFFDLSIRKEDLFWRVLKLEQMLTTGGGWQDQIGGIVGGIKYIESKPGYKPFFLIHQLDPFMFQEKEMHARFTLFYTGITRLAKNILQDVVLQANGNTPAYIFTINNIKQLAYFAKDAILSRDLLSLAEIIAQSWEANKQLHYSTTNDEIEALLENTKEYYAGVKLLGAGGGGYALFISEDIEQADKLKMSLQKNFVSDRARLVDMSLNTDGLQISVS